MAQKGDVDLGFIAYVNDWKLQSKFFPCKVGGRPAWLDLKDLPLESDMLCKVCNNNMVLLMQMYSPIPDIDSCFHRTVFVFMCRNLECNQSNCADNYKAFRCQLPQTNAFYSYECREEGESESSDYEDDESESPQEDKSQDIGPSASDFVSLCSLCGCRGAIKCTQCTTTYCSAQHQRLEWKLGHKEKCKGLEKSTKQKKRRRFLLPEYGIITETLDYGEPQMTEQTEEERVKQSRKSAKGKSSKREEDLKDLETIAQSKSDKWILRFKEIIKSEPEQILRYQRGGTPLWVSKEYIRSDEGIPPCPCGANRQFEFQIMPQLLNGLELDASGRDFDFGSLLIYTCSSYCDHDDKAYHEEYVFKQDFSSENL